MKIGIIGDTHGMREIAKKLCQYFSDVELFFHTGDHWQDGVYIEEQTGIPVLMVKGNCDRGEMSSELIINIKGKKFFLTHGHIYGVKYGMDILKARAQELAVDYCIFGHTHRPLIESVNGICFLNPGSLTWPRTQCNYAGIILEYQDDFFTADFLEVDM